MIVRFDLPDFTIHDITAVLRQRFTQSRPRLREELRKAQDTKCAHCGIYLYDAMGSNKGLHVHHRRPILHFAQLVIDGTLTLNMADEECNGTHNLLLMHDHCHNQMEQEKRQQKA